jgi:hypothetical protein
MGFYDGYGARLQAAAAYHSPKARLEAPSDGAMAPNAACAGRATSSKPKPVDRTLIETGEDGEEHKGADRHQRRLDGGD